MGLDAEIRCSSRVTDPLSESVKPRLTRWTGDAHLLHAPPIVDAS